MFATCSKGLIAQWDVRKLEKPFSSIKGITPFYQIDEYQEYVSALNYVYKDKYLVAGYIDGYMVLLNNSNLSDFKKVRVGFETKQPDVNLDPGNTVR